MPKRDRLRVNRTIVAGLLDRGFVPTDGSDASAVDDGFSSVRPLSELPHAKLETFFVAESYRHGGDKISADFSVVLDSDAVRDLCPGPVGDYWLSLDMSPYPIPPMLVWCDASELWGGRGIAPDVGGFVFDRERENDAVRFVLETLDTKVYDALVAPVLSAEGLRAKAVSTMRTFMVSPTLFRSCVALLFAADFPELAEDAIAEYLEVPDSDEVIWNRTESRDKVEAFADWARSVPRSRWDEFCGDWTLPPTANTSEHSQLPADRPTET